MANDEFFRLLKDYHEMRIEFTRSMQRRDERRRSQSVVQVYLERDGGWTELLNVRCRLSGGDLEIFSAIGRGGFDLDHLSDAEWFRLEQAIFKKGEETDGKAEQGRSSGDVSG